MTFVSANRVALTCLVIGIKQSSPSGVALVLFSAVLTELEPRPVARRIRTCMGDALCLSPLVCALAVTHSKRSSTHAPIWKENPKRRVILSSKSVPLYCCAENDMAAYYCLSFGFIFFSGARRTQILRIRIYRRLVVPFAHVIYELEPTSVN